MAESNDSNVADTIDIKVSSTTCFSIAFLLSIFPTKIAANPNNTVNTSEKTVVSTSASFSSITDSNPNVMIAASTIGINRKHAKSQSESLFVFAFLKTCNCLIKTEKIRTFLFPNSIRKMMTNAMADQIYLIGISRILRFNYCIIIVVR